MRKASYIIALSLITVFITGNYFLYKGVLKSHKKEFKSYIRTHYSKTEQIEISPSELYTDNSNITWLDDNKEVCINGEMFDVLSIKNNGTKVLLCVVNDKDEKELMTRYQNQFNDIYENGNTGKQNNNLIKDFLSLKFFQKSSSQIIVFAQGYNYSEFSKSNICTGFYTIQIPPPLG